MASSPIRPSPPRLVAPSDNWSPLIEAYFSFSGPSPALILPTGGVDLMFVKATTGGDTPPSMMIHGYLSRGFVPPEMSLRGVGIRFRPGGFTALTGIPQSEVADDIYDASQVFSRSIRTSVERRAYSSSINRAPERLEEIVESISSKSGAVPSGVVELVRLSRHRIGDISRLASRLGISTRHLERISRQYLGTSPKTLSRVQRLRSCLRRRLSGTSWSEAATETGFADQSHFSRECRVILGVTPTRFLELWGARAVFRV